jgi:shikimate kinase
MKDNIVLAGFMGTGKTTVARAVAVQLDWAFVDTDVEIEHRAGQRIADIFTQQGEPTFRRLEAEVCLDVAAGRQQVIATGGGALLNPTVVEAFSAHSLIVCLTCDLDEIIRRVGRDPLRPLFSADRDQLAARLAARQEQYNRLPVQLDTTHCTPLQVAEKVIVLWQQS